MIAKQELDGLKDAIERGGNYSIGLLISIWCSCITKAR